MQTNNNNKTPAAQQETDGFDAILKAAGEIESNSTPNDGSTYPSTPNATSLQTPYDDHAKASAYKKGAAAVDLLKVLIKVLLLDMVVVTYLERLLNQ